MIVDKFFKGELKESKPMEKKCERCGKLYEDRRDGLTFFLDVNPNGYFKRSVYDLCPECCEELIKWFKEPGENK